MIGRRERIVLGGFSAVTHGLTRLELSGTDTLPDVAALWCGNHRSVFDPFVAYAAVRAWDHPISNLTHEKFLRWPVVGWALRAVQCVPITSSDPAESVEAAVSLLRSGRSVGLMPEGGVRNAEQWIEGLGELRGGAARILAEIDVPVVAMAITGTDGVISADGKVHLFNRPNVRASYEVLGRIGHGANATELIAASLRRQLAAATAKP